MKSIVRLLGEGKTRVPREKPLGAEQRTNNLNPLMMPSPGIELRTLLTSCTLLSPCRVNLSISFIQSACIHKQNLLFKRTFQINYQASHHIHSQCLQTPLWRSPHLPFYMYPCCPSQDKMREINSSNPLHLVIQDYTTQKTSKDKYINYSRRGTWGVLNTATLLRINENSFGLAAKA